jgi:uncharacterized protein (DUF983 family)
MEGQTENFTPREQNSPLGDNFAPWGQSLPLREKLRKGLRSRTTHCKNCKTKKKLQNIVKIVKHCKNCKTL